MRHTAQLLCRQIITLTILIIFALYSIPHSDDQAASLMASGSLVITGAMHQREIVVLHRSVSEETFSVADAVSAEIHNDSANRYKTRLLTPFLSLTMITQIFFISVLIVQLLTKSDSTHRFSVISYQHLADGKKASI